MTKKVSDEKSREDLNLGSDLSGQEIEPEIGGAPAFIKERSKSERPKPPESQDVEYLSREEIMLDDRISTYTTVLVEDPNASDNHIGPFIERCVGRNPESRKLMVVRIPAREIPVLPTQIIRYLGHVVQDHLAVHTARIKYKQRAWGYSFDHFYIYNKKRLTRVCYVPDHIHQAAIVYEKEVDKKTHEPYSRIKQIRGPMGQSTGQPMYEVVGAGESYYRDLKRLFERHFMNRGDASLAGDEGLRVLLQSINP